MKISLFIIFLFNPVLLFGQFTLQDSLFVHFPMDGNTIDFSGKNNDGINFNVSSTTDRNGNPNSAMHFNGTNAFIEVGDIINMPNENAITITGWFRPENIIPPINRYAGVSFGKKITGELALRYSSETLTVFSAAVGDGSNISSNGNNTGALTSNIPFNQWVYISATFENGLVRIFKNAELESTNNTGNGTGGLLQHIPSDAILRVGQAFNTNNSIRYFRGDMDDLRIYNRKLSDCEIKRLYDPNYQLSSYSLNVKCNEDSLFLSQPGYLNYYWSINGIPSSNSSSITISGNGNSIITLEGIDQYGCTHFDTFNIKQGGRDSKYLQLGKCKEDSFLLINSEELNSIEWFKNGIQIASLIDSVIIKDTTTVLISLKGLDSLGCLIRDTFLIYSNSPISALDDYDKNICQSTLLNRTYSVIGNGFSEFDWIITGGVLVEDKGREVMVDWEDLTNTSLKVFEISLEGCAGDTLEFPFFVDSTTISLDLITFSEDFKEIELKGNYLSGISRNSLQLLADEYDSTFKELDENFDLRIDTSEFVLKSIYQLAVEDACNGELLSSSAKPVLLNIETDISESLINISWQNYLGWDEDNINNEIFELKNDGSILSISNIGSLEIYSLAFETEYFRKCFFIESENTYLQLVSRSNLKCIELIGDLFIPNIVTANGDGYNDKFLIRNIELFPNHKLSIFNRWGISVFNSTNYNNNWPPDKLSSGVYFFELIINNEEKQRFSGYLHLLR